MMMTKPLPERMWLWWLRTWRQHLVTLLMALLAFALVGAWRTRQVPEGLAPDVPLPAVRVAGNGLGFEQLPAWDLARWRQSLPPQVAGCAVALHVWAQWCPYCKVEETSVTRVAADWPVLTVAYRSGPAGAVQQVMAQRALPWTALVDEHGEWMSRYGLGVVPAWVVLTPDGHIHSVTTGYTTEVGMRARLWWAQGFRTCRPDRSGW